MMGDPEPHCSELRNFLGCSMGCPPPAPAAWVCIERKEMGHAVFPLNKHIRSFVFLIQINPRVPRKHKVLPVLGTRTPPTVECTQLFLNAYYVPLSRDMQGPNSTKGPVDGIGVGKEAHRWGGVGGIWIHRLSDTWRDKTPQVQRC